MQTWEDNYEGADVLSKVLVESSGSEEPLAQGRCSGFGGGVKVVKVSKGGCHEGNCEHSEHSEQPRGERKEMDLARLERAPLTCSLSAFAPSQAGMIRAAELARSRRLSWS